MKEPICRFSTSNFDPWFALLKTTTRYKASILFLRNSAAVLLRRGLFKRLRKKIAKFSVTPRKSCFLFLSLTRNVFIGLWFPRAIRNWNNQAFAAKPGVVWYSHTRRVASKRLWLFRLLKRFPSLNERICAMLHAINNDRKRNYRRANFKLLCDYIFYII
jgi:hypothetical protein